MAEYKYEHWKKDVEEACRMGAAALRKEENNEK